MALRGAVDDLAGPRAPGAVDAINAALEQAAGGFGKQISPQAARTAKETIAQASGDLQAVLALQKKDQVAAREALASSNAVGKDREALNQALAAATAAVIATERAIKAQNEASAKAAQEAAKAKLSEDWNSIIGALDLGVSKAELTKPLNDDLSALLTLQAGLEKQVRAGVDAAAAAAKLVQVTGQIAAKREEIAQAASDAVQAKQFRALGLSATGDEFIPGIENLSKRLNAVLTKIGSGDVDISSKLVGRLKEARQLIAKEGDGLKAAVRDTINGFIKEATSVIGRGGASLDASFRVANFSDKFKDLGCRRSSDRPK